jgi:hypothetical protein
MQTRPLLVLAALAAAADPDLGRTAVKQLKDGLRGTYAGDPLGTTTTAVVVASWLFYRAERGKNPKVNSFYDALVYVSTNLSVGYCDILAKTPAGKLLGSALMTVGPAMATRALDEERPAGYEPDARVVERLDRILAALEARAAVEILPA